jgi:hypothetical protein
MIDVAAFFAGVFLCNGVPHLTSGLCGLPFPTPFAKPRGVGNSSPLVNFFWGLFNVLAGAGLLARHPVSIGVDPGFIALVCGAAAIGTYLSLHFGKVRLSPPGRNAPVG